MKKKMLYTVALNKEGILVKANDAEKADNYFCPVCETALILKKSGKTGKGSKRPHFAHDSLTANCTPEGVLHYSFKKMLLDKIKNCISNKLPINMTWKCNHCHEEHGGNLLKRAFDVKDEYDMETCKPDIALFDEKRNVFAVIEIIVTHEPEDTAINYYKTNNIILIQIRLDSEDDLENIDGKIEKPSEVDFCVNPKCSNCGSYMLKKNLIVVTNNCYSCEKPMKICYIDKSFIIKSPSSFNDKEINLAKSKGVMLKMCFSQTSQETYLANKCPNCWAFIGDFYLHDYISEHNKQIYFAGYYCDKCDD
jgi:hypothetical protein